MQAVVCGIDRDGAAGDVERGFGLDTLCRQGFVRRCTLCAAKHSIARFLLSIRAAACGDIYFARGNENTGLRLNAVLLGGDVHSAPADIDIALIGLGFGGLDAVAGSRDMDGTVLNEHSVFADEAVVCRSDIQNAAGDFQFIFARDAVICVGVDVQRARAVNGKVAFGENRGGKRIVAVRAGDGIGHGAFGVFGQADNDFIGVFRVDRRGRCTGDARVFEHKAHIILVAGINDNLAVRERAAEDIRARFRNGDRAAGNLNAVCFLWRGKVDLHGVFRTVIDVEILIFKGKICFDDGADGAVHRAAGRIGLVCTAFLRGADRAHGRGSGRCGRRRCGRLCGGATR